MKKHWTEAHPHLLKEWHWLRNVGIDPMNSKVKDKVWWCLPYDDPETGKHYDFEWQATISNRIQGDGCPFLSGQAVWTGFNDLATKRLDLISQWHPTKNGNKTPETVVCGCKDKVWWYLPYDDPVTGKHFDFEWPAIINSRVKGNGCPYLSGHAVWPGFNDLATKRPDLAAQWHPIKNGELTPKMVTCHSNKKVWWYLSYDDPETGKHFDFEWSAHINTRVKTSGCPYLSGHAVWSGFNDLATKRPDLAIQWHPIKNGELTPEMVTYCSNKKVWWYLPFVDSETRDHFGFEWRATISNRIQGNDCPYLSGKAAWPGFNDLATKYPDLAAQWHPTKNGKLTPEMVTCHSEKKVWWYLLYDDPETGKQFGFVWQASISVRVHGNGCPFLSGQAVWPGYNDLATKHPDLAAQWHSIKNGELTPEMVTCYSNKKVWWYLPYDDPETRKRFEFAWQATIANRLQGNSCPFLSGQAVWPGYNDMASKRPDLAAQWHPTKNGKLTPEMVTCYTHKKVWWYLPYDDPKTGKHFDFEWQAYIPDRVNSSGCPFLSGQAVWPGYNDMASKRPDLAAQWHPTKNGKLTPEMVTCHSNKKVWWYLPYDDSETGMHFDFEWQTVITSRVQGCGCPFLVGKAVWTGYNDLGSKSSTIAREWIMEKNRRKKTSQIYMKEMRTRRWWKCSKCECVWRATVYERTVKGVTCPNCRRKKNYYA